MFKKIFVRGLIALLPLVLTFALCVWLFSSLESFFGFWLNKLLPQGYYFKGLGILIGIVLVFIVGILMQAWVVNKIYEFGERILRKIPLIKTIYNALADVMAFLSPKDDGKRAVIVELPQGRALGFITADTPSRLPAGLLKEGEVLVYVPLSYQLGGQTIAVPISKITYVDWSAEKTMSFILTAGLAGKEIPE